jgi:hypothetical protein
LALPAAEYQSTIDAQYLTMTALAQNAAIVMVITSTPGGDEGGILVPEETAIATIDPCPSIPTNLPPGEPRPRRKAMGVSGILSSQAIRLLRWAGVRVFPVMLLANDMDENDILNIGDVLIIPVEGCARWSVARTVGHQHPFQLTPPAQHHPAADGVNAQVEITNVQFSGDVNSEAVEIRVWAMSSICRLTLSTSGRYVLIPRIQNAAGQSAHFFAPGTEHPARCTGTRNPGLDRRRNAHPVRLQRAGAVHVPRGRNAAAFRGANARIIVYSRFGAEKLSPQRTRRAQRKRR